MSASHQLLISAHRGTAGEADMDQGQIMENFTGLVICLGLILENSEPFGGVIDPIEYLKILDHIFGSPPP